MTEPYLFEKAIGQQMGDLCRLAVGDAKVTQTGEIVTLEEMLGRGTMGVSVEVPYTSSGVQSVTVYRGSTTDVRDADSTTITLPANIYGGTVNLEAGTVTSRYAADGTELAEPVVTEIDPISIPILAGVNNVWADVGTVTVSYYAADAETFRPALWYPTIYRGLTSARYLIKRASGAIASFDDAIAAPLVWLRVALPYDAEGYQSVKIQNGDANVPDTYQPVEYLESFGSQYIDTEIMPKQNSTRWEFGAQFTELVTSGTQMMGAGWNHYQRMNILLQSSSSVIRYSIGQYAFDDTSTKQDTNYHKFVLNAYQERWIAIDGTYTRNNDNPSFTDNSNIGLFARIRPGATDYYCKARIFYSKIFEGDTLVQYLLPVYRKSDGKPGMYDVVSGKFLTNQGSGADFIIGEKQSFDITLPTTIYGGYLDVVTGQLIATHDENGNLLANQKLYFLPPTNISALAGVNNIWSDAGDVAVSYRIDNG